MRCFIDASIRAHNALAVVFQPRTTPAVPSRPLIETHLGPIVGDRGLKSDSRVSNRTEHTRRQKGRNVARLIRIRPAAAKRAVSNAVLLPNDPNCHSPPLCTYVIPKCRGRVYNAVRRRAALDLSNENYWHVQPTAQRIFALSTIRAKDYAVFYCPIIRLREGASIDRRFVLCFSFCKSTEIIRFGKD